MREHDLYIECVVCGKITKGGRQPIGGDGTFKMPRRHLAVPPTNANFGYCEGIYLEGIWHSGKPVVDALTEEEDE